MTHAKKKKIVPLYIKNAHNKVTDIYLDITTYNDVIKKINKFKKIHTKKVTQNNS